MSFRFTLSEVPVPGEWAERGWCAGEMDLFFSSNKHDIALAKSLCSECSVIDICRDFAMPYPMLHGVWGGMSYRERQVLRRALLRRAG